MSIEINHISKHYGDFQALDDISLTIPTGKLVAILGPSGCGKTTLLRTVAGLERADEKPGADILFDGVSALNSPVNRRKVGFVFQHYALFRQMTVADNVAFGLTVKPRAERPDKATIKKRVADMLDLVQLSRLGSRYPDGRTAPARRPRASARHRAEGPAPRRAVRRARRAGARIAPPLAAPSPRHDQRYLHLRHARPGGGA